MRMSRLAGMRYKETPSEARLASHAFLLRGGYIRQVSNGIYSLLPPAKRVVAKIERIIREEMDRIGGQEVLMPVALPRELWDESGRYESVGSELVRFKDRTGHDMLLAMTHEEAVVHLCRNEIHSYAQLPLMVYQLQTKFRDEPRSRGGLIRVREFTMKDAYSFHRTAEDLDEYYQQCCVAYERIFQRVGLPEVIAVQSDSGMMGGRVAHEFMLLCDAGEDTIATCDTCAYRANMEVAQGHIAGQHEPQLPLEKVQTPDCRTIEEVAGFLGVPTSKTAKAVFYTSGATGELVFLVIRGDLQVNETKLANLLHAAPAVADDALIRAAGAVPGFASPMGVDAARCRILVDQSIAGASNLVCGANEEHYHYRNFNLERDLPGATMVALAEAREGDGCPSCKSGHLVLRRGVEVGNVFQLGTKYTQSMGMTYTDEQGQPQVPIMGCYGIGVGRLMSSVMEARHDEYGPCWPMSIAPWHVAIVALQMNKRPARDAAERLHAQLTEAGVEVLYDDRDLSPGAKFAEADLLGIPLRFTVSERNIAQGVVEWKRRDAGTRGTVREDEAAGFATGTIAAALKPEPSGGNPAQ